MKFICYIASTILVAVLLQSCFGPNREVLEKFKNISEDSIVVSKDTFSYAQVSENEIVVSDIPEWRSVKKITLDDFCDSVFFVSLQCDAKNVIGRIDEMKIIDDTIYVLDRWKSRALFRFDMKGNFVDRIGKRGRGPFEYVEITSFSVSDSLIMIYDQFQQKMVFFSHEGNSRAEKFLPFACIQAEMVPGGYLFRGINAPNFHLKSIADSRIWFTDNDLHIKKSGMFCPNGKYQDIFISGLFQKNKDGVYFFDEYNTQMYVFDDSLNVKNAYHLVFADRHDASLYLEENSKKYIKASNSGEFLELEKFFPLSDDRVFMTFSGTNAVLLHNPKNSSDFVFNQVYSKKSEICRFVFHVGNALCTYKDDYIVTEQRSDLLPYYYKALNIDGIYADSTDVWRRDGIIAAGIKDGGENNLLSFLRIRK